MNQMRQCRRTCSAAGNGRFQTVSRSTRLLTPLSHTDSSKSRTKRNLSACASLDYHPLSQGTESACFSGRLASSEERYPDDTSDIVNPNRHPNPHPCGSLPDRRAALHTLSSAAHAAWRATLTTAASAVLLQGSLGLPMPSPPSASIYPSNDPTNAATPWVTRALGQPAAAQAAEPPSDTGGGAAAKAARLRQLATPDPKAMQELSEEVASRPPPPGAKVEAAGAGSSSSSNDSRIGGTALRGDPNARLKAQDLAELLHIPVSQAKTLLASQRELGQTSRGFAAASFEALREVLGLAGEGGLRGAQAVGRVAARDVRLLTVAAPELKQRFAEVQSLLLAPLPVARSVVAAQPALLTQPPQILRSRLSDLCPVFNVDPSLASEIAKHEPGLLVAAPGELSARSAALAAELKLTKPQVIAVLRRFPQALLSTPEALRTRLRSLAALLDIPRGEPVGTVVLNAPRLLVMAEKQAARQLEALQSVLQVSRERAQAIAAAHPLLLVTPDPVLEERLATLAELARVPLGQARRLVEQRPHLLTRSAATMRRAVAEAEAAEAGLAAKLGAAEQEAAAAGARGQQQGGLPWSRR